MTYVSNDPIWVLCTTTTKVVYDWDKRYINVLAAAANSLETVSYIELTWHCGIGKLMLTPKCSRYAILENHIMFLAVNIACGVIAAIALSDAIVGDEQLGFSMIWMPNTVWEVLALI
ncbi:hypothetical protein EV424DRAFT_1347042 [Suillus variegatus]|nr:hypothetical protein EV424DRAFT_1347042 [Suillus variegatus]